ncbi:MAG: hypothetical protein HKN44_11245 [Ilumatobacter sp.]|nr:hypothetical protein [Ilumatobacter sp.]
MSSARGKVALASLAALTGAILVIGPLDGAGAAPPAEPPGSLSVAGAFTAADGYGYQVELGAEETPFFELLPNGGFDEGVDFWGGFNNATLTIVEGADPENPAGELTADDPTSDGGMVNCFGNVADFGVPTGGFDGDTLSGSVELLALEPGVRVDLTLHAWTDPDCADGPVPIETFSVFPGTSWAPFDIGPSTVPGGTTSLGIVVELIAVAPAFPNGVVIDNARVVNESEIEEGVGNTFFYLAGPTAGCDLSGPGTEPGTAILAEAVCGGASHQSVVIDGCDAELQFHGAVHSDHPKLNYLGSVTVDVDLRAKSATKVDLDITFHTPGGKIPVSVKGFAPDVIEMETCFGE